MESNSTKQKGLLVERPRGRRTLTQCAVCSMPALYSYAGAIVCSPCKVFFKRNVTNKTKQLKCHYDGNCEVNENTRHVCAACRLTKCFASGMQLELLRNSEAPRNVQSNQIQTLSLLRSDQSTLTTEQWNLISNLINCYDENNTSTLANTFMHEQNRLPVKLRYKAGPVNQFLFSIISGVQHVFERNNHFLSLTRNDQMCLLKRTFHHTNSLIGCFLLRISKLYDEIGFLQTIGNIYGESTVADAARGSLFLDPDPTVVKLILSTMIFSTLDTASFFSQTNYQLENPRQVLSILDQYAEITWRYLIYKYDFERAVRCYSRMVQSIFSGINSLLAGGNHANFQEMVDSIAQQTKESLHIND